MTATLTTPCRRCHRAVCESILRRVGEMRAKGWQDRPAYRAAVQDAERVAGYVRADGPCAGCGRSDVPAE